MCVKGVTWCWSVRWLAHGRGTMLLSAVIQEPVSSLVSLWMTLVCTSVGEMSIVSMCWSEEVRPQYCMSLVAIPESMLSKSGKCVLPLCNNTDFNIWFLYRIIWKLFTSLLAHRNWSTVYSLCCGSVCWMCCISDACRNHQETLLWLVWLGHFMCLTTILCTCTTIICGTRWVQYNGTVQKHCVVSVSGECNSVRPRTKHQTVKDNPLSLWHSSCIRMQHNGHYACECRGRGYFTQYIDM